MWALWVTALIGAWFFVSGLIPVLMAEWNAVILGIAAVVFGLIGALANSRVWQGYINALIGIWFFLNGVWFGILAPWNFVIFGIVMFIFGLWGALKHATPRHVTAGA